jgi:hypothetical protein
MAHLVNVFSSEQRPERVEIANVNPMERKVAVWEAQRADSSLFEPRIVRGIEVINANHAISARAERARHRRTNESRCTGDEYRFHRLPIFLYCERTVIFALVLKAIVLYQKKRWRQASFFRGETHCSKMMHWGQLKDFS